MRVRLIRDWRAFHAGRIFAEMPAGAGRVLVRRRIAEELREEPETPLESTKLRKPRKSR